MPILFVLGVLLLGVTGYAAFLVAWYVSSEFLRAVEIKCLDCGFQGSLAPVFRSFLKLFLGMLIFPWIAPARRCPKCGSMLIREVALSEADYLRELFERLSNEELTRIIDEKPPELTPVGLRFARDEMDKRHRRG